jgi:hypothetical protein
LHESSKSSCSYYEKYSSSHEQKLRCNNQIPAQSQNFSSPKRLLSFGVGGSSLEFCIRPNEISKSHRCNSELYKLLYAPAVVDTVKRRQAALILLFLNYPLGHQRRLFALLLAFVFLFSALLMDDGQRKDSRSSPKAYNLHANSRGEKVHKSSVRLDGKFE